jgi:apolipoprotein N-acyltransferase
VRHRLLFLTILSALLYDVAFFFPETLGFLVLVSLILIFLVLSNLTKNMLSKTYARMVPAVALEELWRTRRYNLLRSKPLSKSLTTACPPTVSVEALQVRSRKLYAKAGSGHEAQAGGAHEVCVSKDLPSSKLRRAWQDYRWNLYPPLALSAEPCEAYRRVRSARNTHHERAYGLYGLLWGCTIFSMHFVWLLMFFLDKLKFGLCVAVLAYAFAVIYLSVTSAIWFVVTGKIFESNILAVFCRRTGIRCIAMQLCAFLLLCYSYFYLLENYALWFLGRAEGYPFLNPLIPLVNFRFFANVLILAGRLFSGEPVLAPMSPSEQALHNIEIIYLKPDMVLHNQNSTDQKKERPNLVSYEYNIYRKLCDLKLWERCNVPGNRTKQFIILAPESAFPFPLNMHPDVIELWSNVLPDNVHMILGTQQAFGEKLCQSVVWLNSCRIKKNYVKKHCVPFIERVPHFYKKIEFLRKFFLGDVCQFSRAKKIEQQNYFEFTDKFSQNFCHPELDSGSIQSIAQNKIIFIPQICSELFFTSSYKNFVDIANAARWQAHCLKPSEISAYIIFFVNDSWFTGYFKKIMQGSARLKSLLSGVPLIYVGHENLIFFD